MKLAIIGSGISGLGAAYILQQNHAVTLYEKEPRLGGHSRTIEVFDGQKNIAVDTGFIVYNEKNYPHLIALFEQLGVHTTKSSMSFGTSIANGFLEYSSRGVFADKRNLLRTAYIKMLLDIVRFNKQARAYMTEDNTLSLKELLEKLNMGDWFCRYYILAMGAAIWSCPVETILDFPARTFLQFFDNHGLLSIKNHPQWYTVTGGSREYVTKLRAALSADVRENCAAESIERKDGKVYVTDTHSTTEEYDEVVIACHADEALSLIKNPTHEEQEVLGSFSYQPNEVVVHTDETFMPRTKGCWASWIYLSENREDKNNVVSLTYWMNNLQPLPTDKNIFVTLNPGREPAEGSVINKHIFSHPIFNQRAIDAQKRIPDIQGKDKIWFCGAYQRYGFHEDGLLSAVNMASLMGVSPPWK